MPARDQHGTGAPWGDLQVVGKANRKVDGLAKATGETVYADDIAPPEMLYAKTLRSPHARARIKKLDAAMALSVDKVRLVSDEDAAFDQGRIATPTPRDATRVSTPS